MLQHGETMLTGRLEVDANYRSLGEDPDDPEDPER